VVEAAVVHADDFIVWVQPVEVLPELLCFLCRGSR
jgi:hypothetical protein